MKFKDWLIKQDACGEAINWVGNMSEREAWENCERADWMLWLLAKRLDTPGYPTRQAIVQLGCLVCPASPQICGQWGCVAQANDRSC